MYQEKIEQFLIAHKQPKFRLSQISKAVFVEGISTFSAITTISKDLRELLEAEIRMLSFDIVSILRADDGQSMKALLKLTDGNLIETVLISPKPETWSACVSVQVGCQMGCRFCATGKLGFVRNLTAEEITDQVLFWRQYLHENFKLQVSSSKFANVVFMGMGEPFNNWENVSESIRILTDEKQFGFASRSLSVSTSGIVDGVVRMAEEFPQVNLAVSLHFATDEKRDRFMPVNKKDNLVALKIALQKYFQITKRKVFLEYIMLKDVNDTALDARQLAEYIRSVGNVHLLHVNLIRYNTTSEDLDPSTKERTLRFKEELRKHRVNATIRKSLGDEIKGACGQLAGK